jgi:hypothetical protein
MNTENQDKPVSRKKFVAWGLGALSVLTAARYFWGAPKKPTPQTIKMLGQDGKLVEVDVTNLGCGKRKKISDEELKKWVIRK